MSLIIRGIIVAAAAVLVLVLAAAAWFCFSPMPVVRMLRKGMDAQLSYPPGYEERKKKVRILRGLPYPSQYGRNVYDLYLPETASDNPQGRIPVILWIHGGAFVAGDRSGVENWAVMLASEGLAVAAMEYQWAPEARYPAQVEQACQCLKALREQGDRIDLEQVVLAGDSAGAHIAAQTVQLHTNPLLGERIGLHPVLKPGAVKAALLYCGPYEVDKMAPPKDRMMRMFMDRIGWSVFGKKRWRKLPALETTVISHYVTPEFPPAYITDGNAHSFERQGRTLAETLAGKGVPVRTRFYPAEDGEVNHEYQFSLQEETARLCYEDTVEFLREQGILKQRTGRNSNPGC